MMTISTLAKAASVGVETVRFYQRRGLMDQPDRGGQSGAIRRYDAGHVRQLRFIRSAQAAGFTLDQIGELLRLDAADDRARARALAQEQLAVLDRKIAELEDARSALQRLARECAASNNGPCPILAAFDEGGCRAPKPC